MKRTPYRGKVGEAQCLIDTVDYEIPFKLDVVLLATDSAIEDKVGE